MVGLVGVGVQVVSLWRFAGQIVPLKGRVYVVELIVFKEGEDSCVRDDCVFHVQIPHRREIRRYDRLVVAAVAEIGAHFERLRVCCYPPSHVAYDYRGQGRDVSAFQGAGWYRGGDRCVSSVFRDHSFL